MKLENKTHTHKIREREKDTKGRREIQIKKKKRKGKMKSEQIVKEIKSGQRKKFNEIENSKIESTRQREIYILKVKG